MGTPKEPATETKSTKARAPRARATATRSPARGKSTKSTAPPVEVTAEERWRMIAVAAYHKAEQRGFEHGSPEQDWFEAEKEVDALLGSRGKIG
jgi:hypothetical protein